MERLPDPFCGKCKLVPSDLVHLLWRCPKLHGYWSEVLAKLNGVFQTNVPLDPICCLLDVLEEVVPEEMTRVAFSRALFQARKTILLGCKSATPPSVKSWMQHMGNTLLERYLCQHRGGLTNLTDSGPLAQYAWTKS